MRALALLMALSLPTAALAGGYAGQAVQACAALSSSGTLVAGATCIDRGRVVVVQADQMQGGFFYQLLRERPTVEYVNGRWCPYPHRPSDSAFSGGAGYIIKNDVRAVIGCAF